ncbi:MAG: hypothetical protein IPM53_29500 [Anaerolineaceae bacterium]|nr:hypothetical protein [Anaerolineaceae bacterium]
MAKDLPTNFNFSMKSFYVNSLAETRVPSLAEQNRIVELFETVDHEIAVAEKQHVALQQQKKGLMQRLLTGQIRVNTAHFPGNSEFPGKS